MSPTTATESSQGTSVRAAERAYAVLKGRLLDGSYRAGDRLHVESLTSELGVSKQPVMESLRRLSAEGLVVITPQVGCSVIRYDDDEIHDFFELMAGIEGAASAMAAVRRSRVQLDDLEEISAQVGRLFDDPSLEARAHGYRMLNRDFHGLIHEMCGTEIVTTVGSSMMDRADFFINSSSPGSPFGTGLAERHADHEAILSAIADRDPEAARKSASDHIRKTVDLIKQAGAGEPHRSQQPVGRV